MRKKGKDSKVQLGLLFVTKQSENNALGNNFVGLCVQT